MDDISYHGIQRMTGAKEPLEHSSKEKRSGSGDTDCRSAPLSRVGRLQMPSLTLPDSGRPPPLAGFPFRGCVPPAARAPPSALSLALGLLLFLSFGRSSFRLALAFLAASAAFLDSGRALSLFLRRLLFLSLENGRENRGRWEKEEGEVKAMSEAAPLQRESAADGVSRPVAPDPSAARRAAGASAPGPPLHGFAKG